MGALKALASGGGEWVIWFLILCSILAVAVMVERALVHTREKKALAVLKDRATSLLSSKDFEEWDRVAEKAPGAAGRILAAGLRHGRFGPAAVEERLAGARMLEKKFLEDRLLVLGTLGNNAPFVGLFGTVLGVIKAFHDLSATASAGPEVVMQGLSEALVATAVGLLVAMPSVVAYNYFQKSVNDLLTETDALATLLLAKLKETKSGK
jgi:biopolymer transport protein ExbB